MELEKLWLLFPHVEFINSNWYVAFNNLGRPPSKGMEFNLPFNVPKPPSLSHFLNIFDFSKSIIDNFSVHIYVKCAMRIYETPFVLGISFLRNR